MEPSEGGGYFGAVLRGASAPLRYRLRFHFAGGGVWEQEDPYRFLPSLGDMDIYLISEGTHRALWQVLGAHPRQLDGVDGVGFAVWAPNAQGVSVVGDFCRWDERRLPDAATRRVRGVRAVRPRACGPAQLYKYRIIGPARRDQAQGGSLRAGHGAPAEHRVAGRRIFLPVG